MNLNKEQIDKLLWIYNPEARYLTQVTINPPEIKAELYFPEKTIYVNNRIKVNHINNTDVTIIGSQLAFLFYNHCAMQGIIGFPKLSTAQRNKIYLGDSFIKKQEIYYVNFKEREKEHKCLFEHTNMRKFGNLYFLWYEFSIENFVHSKVVGGLRFLQTKTNHL